MNGYTSFFLVVIVPIILMWQILGIYEIGKTLKKIEKHLEKIEK